MKPAELLDAAKTRLCLKSDYELALRMGIRPQHMGEIRNGKRAMSLHLIYWLAITLERDPAALVAEIEEGREKNENRKAFWRSFLSRAAVIAGTCCTLVLVSFGTGGNARAATGGLNASADNPYYVKY